MSNKFILLIIFSICLTQIVQSLKVNSLGHSNDHDDNDNDKKQCSGDNCKIIDHCLIYQVSTVFNNYGCTKCSPKYMLNSDLNGSGTCTLKNPIENCLWASNEPDVLNGKPFCWECKKNYQKSLDRSTCTLLPKNERIENCLNYWVDDKGNTICNECKNGFILSEDQFTCSGECTIEGCTSCAIINGGNYCWACDEGLISIYNNTVNLYSECIDCKTWLGKLLTRKL
jgi:hypothetical protein